MKNASTVAATMSRPHVRQVERVGPFFLPAYVAATMWAGARGGHFYLDNRFERDARRSCGEWW